MKRKEAEKVYKLIKAITKAAVQARTCPKPAPTKYNSNWHAMRFAKQKKLLELLYGTSDLKELGLIWGMISEERAEKTFSMKAKQRAKCKRLAKEFPQNKLQGREVTCVIIDEDAPQKKKKKKKKKLRQTQGFFTDIFNE